MRILLVRHALAVRRQDWSEPDALRPLVEKGLRQANGLIDLLAENPIDRIATSPFVRCVQTVQPLADALGLELEVDELLAERQGAAAVSMIGRRQENCVVLCSHGDTIPEILEALTGEANPHDRPFAKGSTWIVDTDFKNTPTYLPPVGKRT